MEKNKKPTGIVIVIAGEQCNIVITPSAIIFGRDTRAPRSVCYKLILLFSRLPVNICTSNTPYAGPRKKKKLKFSSRYIRGPGRRPLYYNYYTGPTR